jgi:transposase
MTAPRSPQHATDAARPSLQVTSLRVGALPLINHFFERMQLAPLLDNHLPREGRQVRLGASSALLVLVRNMLLSREPVYGVGEWAALYAPDLLGLSQAELASLNDDRLGRALDRVFDVFGRVLLLDVVRHVVREFQVRLDQLHNDSTTVSVYGAYAQADKEGQRRGQPTCAITFGHSKDHRPDLKQLLYILTISEDGGVPVHVRVASGNTTDDTTHRETWDLLYELVGGPHFLYVADCKLATSENLRHIAGRDGEFLSVLPATRREDAAFRQRLLAPSDSLTWRWLYDVQNDQPKVVDRFFVCEQEFLTKEGWRLWWYRSDRKRERDAAARAGQLERAMAELLALQTRLVSPRTRFRKRAQVKEAVEAIFAKHPVQAWLNVTIHNCQQTHYRQVGPGRPGPNTPYVQERKTYFELTWKLNEEALAQERRCDGVFPLVTNASRLDALQTLRTYKQQPTIEKRFSQLKTDFAVAPIWLKEVSRVQALLGLYFFVLLTQSLLERELRQAMERAGLESLPLYPEGRACRHPTARRVFDVFEPIQRHVVRWPDGSEQVSVTELTPLQRQIVTLLGLDPDRYGY